MCRAPFEGKCRELQIAPFNDWRNGYLCEPCGAPYERELTRAMESRRG